MNDGATLIDDGYYGGLSSQITLLSGKAYAYRLYDNDTSDRGSGDTVMCTRKLFDHVLVS